ncbi:MAG TPA: hypothetical protein VJU82_15810 [Acidobacteriaceae bacterium]|nr:hypothetical protein [Acidobacteriaceae bacterium]
MPLISRRHAIAATFAFGLLTCCPAAHASESALSDAEVEKIRDARLDPAACVELFVKFLDLRVQEIQDMYAKPRRPGREEDTRDLLEQFTSIADELGDNLDDYGPRHADLRKALPKIVQGTERWSSALKSPPEDATYSIARKLALESIRDIRESATQLTSEQEEWFKLHPPKKQKQQQAPEPIDIPR